MFMEAVLKEADKEIKTYLDYYYYSRKRRSMNTTPRAKSIVSRLTSLPLN